MAQTPSEMVEEARKVVPEVTAAETHDARERGEVDLIVDVREPNEWEAGHIPGAIHAPRGLLEWLADESYPNHNPALAGARDRRVVVHCAAGARSLLAAETLKKMGYTDVASMAGGFNDWKAAGLPVE